MSSSNPLIKFDAACKAVAEARTFYDALEIREKAEALRAYGKIAKDKTIEQNGLEIRLRAERRLGQMIAEAKAAGQLALGNAKAKVAGTGRGNKGKKSLGLHKTQTFSTPNLASQGIDKNLAHRARALANIPDTEFESKLGRLRLNQKLEDAKERSVVREFYGKPEKQLRDINDFVARQLSYWNNYYEKDSNGFGRSAGDREISRGR